MAARFKWNSGGFNTVRNLPAVLNRLSSEAGSRARQAGPGYETRGPETGGSRGRAAVITGTAEARMSEARNHNLGRG